MYCWGPNLFWHGCYDVQILGPQRVDYRVMDSCVIDKEEGHNGQHCTSYFRYAVHNR